jgi:hypothetical protein
MKFIWLLTIVLVQGRLFAVGDKSVIEGRVTHSTGDSVIVQDGSDRFLIASDRRFPDKTTLGDPLRWRFTAHTPRTTEERAICNNLRTGWSGTPWPTGSEAPLKGMEPLPLCMILDDIQLLNKGDQRLPVRNPKFGISMTVPDNVAVRTLKWGNLEETIQVVMQAQNPRSSYLSPCYEARCIAVRSEFSNDSAKDVAKREWRSHDKERVSRLSKTTIASRPAWCFTWSFNNQTEFCYLDRSLRGQRALHTIILSTYEWSLAEDRKLLDQILSTLQFD